MRLRPDGSLWVVRPPAATAAGDNAAAAAAGANLAGAANAAGELAATQTTTRSTWRRGAASSGVTAVIPRAMTSRSQPAVVMAAAGVAGAPGGAGWQRASLSRSATAMAGGGTGGAPSELFVVADDVTVDRAGIELRARPVTVAAADATAATTVTARRQRVDCDVRRRHRRRCHCARLLLPYRPVRRHTLPHALGRSLRP